ncbi:MAG: plasmid recombination protein [Lachnospiraceae bacterium]|nr:plasmid recombination protein [Lachnospiraceae bacterium]
MKRTISAMVGEGSVNHNSRKFIAENIDCTRTHLNRVYVNEDVKAVYHELFDDAVARYNARQTRKDRCIKDYYRKIDTGKQEKTFHELIIQIGNKDDMGAMTENGRLAEQILDEYFRGFQERNPTLRVFGAYLHMDEATPHLHIDFVPYISGWKGRGMDTRVSLKQALGALGFQGGTKSQTEWNQWADAEKKQLSMVMAKYDMEWEKKGTHEEHLSVLDYKKQERAREVEELEAQKAVFEAINQTLQDQMLQAEGELQELKKNRDQKQKEAEAARKRAEQYQKKLKELAPEIKELERFAVEYSSDQDQLLPEAGILETGRSYRDKKAKPLVKKLVQVLRSVYGSYLDICRKYGKLQLLYNQDMDKVERLSKRLSEILDENRKLRGKVADYERVKRVLGDWEVEKIVNKAKRQEREQKRREVINKQEVL